MKAADHSGDGDRYCPLVDGGGTYTQAVTQAVFELWVSETPGWDGICVVCGHDWRRCHGECTCLSCNAERQAMENVVEAANIKSRSSRR